MIICQICKREVNNFKDLGRHIYFNHDISKEDYYVQYITLSEKPICKNKNCLNTPSFLSLGRGFRDFCSNKCRNEEFKRTEKYKEHYIKNKKTNFKKYGVEHPYQLKEYQDKQRQTCLNLYGSETYNNREKSKNTCLEKYGTKTPIENKDIQEKSKKTSFEKYNVENFSYTDYWRKKASEFWLKNHPSKNTTWLKNKRKTMEQNGHWLLLSEKTEFELYKLLVRKHTNRTIKKYNISHNSQNHIDHKFSIFEGFKQSILPIVIGSIHNLELLSSKENQQKHRKCSISKEELINEYIISLDLVPLP